MQYNTVTEIDIHNLWPCHLIHCTDMCLFISLCMYVCVVSTIIHLIRHFLWVVGSLFLTCTSSYYSINHSSQAWLSRDAIQTKWPPNLLYYALNAWFFARILAVVKAYLLFLRVGRGSWTPSMYKSWRLSTGGQDELYFEMLVIYKLAIVNKHGFKYHPLHVISRELLIIHQISGVFNAIITWWHLWSSGLSWYK